jgi:hypothetical protein
VNCNEILPENGFTKKIKQNPEPNQNRQKKRILFYKTKNYPPKVINKLQ